MIACNMSFDFIIENMAFRAATCLEGRGSGGRVFWFMVVLYQWLSVGFSLQNFVPFSAQFTDSD